MALLKSVVKQALTDRISQPGIAEAYLFSPKLEIAWCEYLYQPFSGPRLFDVHDLSAVALARLALVGDHLHRLQTDTAYLQRTMSQVEAGLGSNKPRNFILPQVVAEICYDIWNYWSWKCISDTCEKVRLLRFTHGGKTPSVLSLSIQYQASLYELSVLLNEQVKDRASKFPLLLSRRMQFERHFKANVLEPELRGARTYNLFKGNLLFWLLWEVTRELSQGPQ